MTVEWNATRAASNFAKHGVSFAEAETALMDERALAREDISSARKATRKEQFDYA